MVVLSLFCFVAVRAQMAQACKEYIENFLQNVLRLVEASNSYTWRHVPLSSTLAFMSNRFETCKAT